MTKKQALKNVIPRLDQGIQRKALDYPLPPKKTAGKQAG